MSGLEELFLVGLAILGVAFAALAVGWPRRFTTTRPLLFVRVVAAALLALVVTLAPQM